VPHLTPQAHRLLATHHGVASIDQLVQCGVPRHDVRRLQQAGGLELLVQGAYRSPSVPLTELTRCAAVCVAHPRLAIAGPTAGRLWGFRRMPPDQRVHVLAPPASHPTIAPWVVPYRTAHVHDRDIIERPDGIRITSRARTAFDLARTLSPLDLRSVIEQAIAEGGHTEDDMFDVAIDWLSPRRRWARTFLEQLDRRVRGGGAESHHELVLAEALVAAGVRGLVRQHPIELPGYGRARFDLAVPLLRWAIEVDVYPTHREPQGITSDAARDESALSVGWLVSRVPETGFGPALNSTVTRLSDIHRNRRKRFR
jgi:very-short-patch-repair endonuclease